MNILLRYPKIVAAYSPHFEDLFSREGYVHFCRYLSGLLVSENKTVEGINRLFVLDRRNQSSCNRFMVAKILILMPFTPVGLACFNPRRQRVSKRVIKGYFP